MKLFHFSEEPGIERFEPRPPRNHPHDPAVVWAVAEGHASHYCFPRDCPRVVFWVGPDTSETDRNRYFAHTTARKVIAIETAWVSRVRSAVLYIYHLPAESFVLQDETAGYYVSTEAVTPSKVEPAGDLLSRLVASGAELRVTPSLQPLATTLPSSTVAFSMIRLRNASPESPPQ